MDIQLMLEDPEISKTPKFFLKVSNSYFMSTQKYTEYLKNFLFKKRKNVGQTTTMATITDNARNGNTTTKLTNEKKTRSALKTNVGKTRTTNELNVFEQTRVGQ